MSILYYYEDMVIAVKCISLFVHINLLLCGFGYRVRIDYLFENVNNFN